MIEVALFGAGRIGSIHAGNLARQPGVKLKYVVDVNRAAAVELASKHRRRGARGGRGVCRRVDHRRRHRLEHRHACRSASSAQPRRARRSSARSRSTWTSCARAPALRLSRAAGVTCMIGFQRRYDPTFAALKERLLAGEIGEPEMLVDHQPRSGRAAGRLHRHFGRHLQGHADPRLRYLPLDARTTKR